MSIFHSVSEKEVTRAIAGSFLRQLEEYAESDVIIVGGGPSGLMAGREARRSSWRLASASAASGMPREAIFSLRSLISVNFSSPWPSSA